MGIIIEIFCVRCNLEFNEVVFCYKGGICDLIMLCIEQIFRFISAREKRLVNFRTFFFIT